MIEKTMNVAITKCYVNADKKSRCGKFNIHKRILTDMGIIEDSNTVILKYDEKTKEMTMRDITSKTIKYHVNVVFY